MNYIGQIAKKNKKKQEKKFKIRIKKHICLSE